MGQISVQDVVSHVTDRLASGLYPPGRQLPTARALSQELGAHRNTVTKAYKTLADLGLLSSKQGRGTFAVAGVEAGQRQLHVQQASDRLVDALLKARRLNVAEDDLRRLVDKHITEIYHAPPSRGAFVECNDEDLRVATNQIEQQTGIGLEPVLIDTLATDPARIAARFDVVFTSLFHLLEVQELLADVPDFPVAGLYMQPDERALAEIAQITPETRVGIVVSNTEGGGRYIAQIETFSRPIMQLLVRPTDKEIRDLASEVDLIVTSRSRAAQVRRLRLDLPVIELSSYITRESAGRVIEELQRVASGLNADSSHAGAVP